MNARWMLHGEQRWLVVVLPLLSDCNIISYINKDNFSLPMELSSCFDLYSGIITSTFQNWLHFSSPSYIWLFSYTFCLFWAEGIFFPLITFIMDLTYLCQSKFPYSLNLGRFQAKARIAQCRMVRISWTQMTMDFSQPLSGLIHEAWCVLDLVLQWSCFLVACLWKTLCDFRYH